MARELTEAQALERSLLTDFRKRIWRPFMHAVHGYRLIEPGDRIAVCISGGKDSMLMAKCIQILQRRGEIPFTAEYLVMDPGYRPEHRRQIEANARRLGIPCRVFESDVFEVANAQTRHPCFLCARMRRGCLYREAERLGLNKIALGHHMDDVIETALMSMLYGGQLQAMRPMRRADHFPGMRLIRPLYRVEEADICAWRDAHGLRFLQCACRFTEAQQQDSKRRQVKALIAALKEENPNVARNLFGSVHRVQLDTFPGWKHRGVEHDFLEEE